MFRNTLLVLACFAAPLPVFGSVTKQGSAYSGLTIAIHKGVPENPDLIEKIKSQFTSASRLLHEATGGWAYFKDITIVVPETWKKSSSYQNVYNDPYQQAEFRIQTANGAYGEVPYTLQPGGCSEPGQYVHLTPEFILRDDAYVKDVYGPRDRLLVHEWSHLRYGIFDEYGTPGDVNFPLFYFKDGLMEVNLCSEEIKGWIESDEGPICQVVNDHVTRDCVFIPDMTDEQTTTSLMSLHYLPNVNKFCTKEDTATGTVHNSAAPNKQNILCQGRSSWEVVSAHPDFTAQTQKVEPFAVPSFNLARVEHMAPRFVFVLDISGSMMGRPLELMKESCAWFVDDLVKDDSYVGVILFNSGASVLEPVVKVHSGTRKLISARIQSIQAGGGTYIGSGVLAGIQALKTAGLPTEDAVLVVLSDGQDSRVNDQSLLNSIINSKAKIFAVAFGKDTDMGMGKLAEVSNGKSVFITDIHGKSTAELDQVFVTATTVQTDTDMQLVQLLNKPFSLTAASTETTITLDAELGKNSVFTLAGQVDQVDMELRSPTGKAFNAKSAEFSKSKARLQYKFSAAETGKWTVILKKNVAGAVTVDLSLVSEAKDPKQQPIRLVAQIDGGTIDANKGALVYARVTKGEDIVIRANVQAKVASDAGRVTLLTLNDNGAGADKIKDDGTYTGFFNNFQVGEKRYTVTAEVTNRGEAFVKPVRASASPVIMRRKPRVPPKKPASNTFKLTEFQKLTDDPYADTPVGEKANDFDRNTNGGAFIVINNDGNKVDRIKPSTVNDIVVEEAGETKDGTKYMILTWTAPGDNMDVGTPAKLEVRLSLDGKRLSREFSTGLLLDSTHVLKGDLNPRAGGQVHTVTISVPKEILEQTVPKKPFDVYVSVKATDKAGNVADTGRVAAGHFGYEISICEQPTGVFPRARHCDQFYHCSNDVPYVKNCPANLHYSVQSKRCEWPCSAKCDLKIKCSDTP